MTGESNAYNLKPFIIDNEDVSGCAEIVVGKHLVFKSLV